MRRIATAFAILLCSAVVTLPASAQERSRGVSVHMNAYSEDEKALLGRVTSMCRREKIPLFICRASQLPNGWTRAEQ
jgi:hypothetical protein